MLSSQTAKRSKSGSQSLPDCGIYPSDVNTFMQTQLSEAVELSWVWHQMEDCDFKAELAYDILQSLVSVYMLNMWADMAFSSVASEKESQEEDFD